MAFVLANSEDPDEMLHIHLGLHVFFKLHILESLVYKGPLELQQTYFCPQQHHRLHHCQD